LIRLALRCRAPDAELVLAELLELAPSGVEEVGETGGSSGLVEYAIYGAPGELPDLGEVKAAAGEALVDIRTEPVADDWGERWKRFYHPVLIGGRLYVRPPWERRAERGGVVEVVIEPGRAFGTGAHPTTRMCLELLLAASRAHGPLSRILRWLSARARERPGPSSLCDLGTGSGVIAIAAAKLGFRPVLAVDHEAAALEEADRNARANYTNLTVKRLDLREDAAPSADVVTANLDARLLEAVARRWSEGAPRPRTVIASGFLPDEADRIAGYMNAAGLEETRRLASGGWAGLAATRASEAPARRAFPRRRGQGIFAPDRVRARDG
jgi:ribosomal protein L11 methyltransferase